MIYSWPRRASNSFWRKCGCFELSIYEDFLLSLKECGSADSILRRLPYVEVAISESCDEVICAVLSGQSAFFSESFGEQVILVDLRTYPARTTEEPDSDRVMQGAHDGFVETLIMKFLALAILSRVCLNSTSQAHRATPTSGLPCTRAPSWSSLSPQS